ncbi:MAG: succinylglutamate desuccinylase/aspartoacylase family protein [Alphaproteobacteria bacterium]|nr:succinylglutamate desuccinylase/aspartoacylase family protein [Alphaproteobacteria bacterium]
MTWGPVTICGTTLKPGERATVDVPATALSTHTEVTMPVHVVHGRRPGPRLFVCAALHGDEINGVEIIRRLMRQSALRRLSGTLIAVPVVNVLGFVSLSRYLPDRRDLNRSFPGSTSGSLAARLANLFLTEVVSGSTHGIDLHTGAIHRTNYPQIRANLGNADAERLATAFGAPIVINAGLREGSLRAAARESGIPVLVYEAGEALRFEEVSIRAGLRGVLRVMRALEMLPRPKERQERVPPIIIRSSGWARAPSSGVLRLVTHNGALVKAGDRLGLINDPYGETEIEIVARADGIVIGHTTLPVVNEGDALFHIGRTEGTEAAADAMDALDAFESEVGNGE